MNRWLDRLMARVIRLRPAGSHLVGRQRFAPTATAHGRAARVCISATRAPNGPCCVNPELALGEAYMDGRLVFPDDTLLDFLMLLNESWSRAQQAAVLSRRSSRFRFATRRVAQNNSPMRARRNIKHHYDLDGRLYRLFLDSDMQYSCAYFERPGREPRGSAMGEEAPPRRQARAEARPERARHRLGLGRARAVPRRTISASTSPASRSPTEQHRVSNAAGARAAASSAGRASSCRTIARSTRSFDRIVSVGMFEHVGAARYREFFRAAAKLLKPDGVMLLHSIGRFGPPAVTNPWIAKYIFPGGYIPALSEVHEGGRARRPARHRHGDPAPSLRRDAEGVARALPRALGRGGGDLRRALLPHVGLLPRRLGGRLPHRRHDGLPASAGQEPDDALPITRDYMFAAEDAFRAEHEGPESLRLAGE